MGKVWAPISQVLPIRSVLLHFPVLWEMHGEKWPILCEKYENQFLSFTPYEGFCCIFPYYKKLMGQPMHFPYAEVYHRMRIGLEKSTHTMGRVWLSISQTFPLSWVLLQFPVLWEMYGETHALPIWWHRLILSCVVLHLRWALIFFWTLLLHLSKYIKYNINGTLSMHKKFLFT